MRIKKNNEIRTAKEEIMVGIKTTDHKTGAPVALIKGKGDKYDTFSVQEFAEALYGKGVKVTIHTAWQDIKQIGTALKTVQTA